MKNVKLEGRNCLCSHKVRWLDPWHNNTKVTLEWKSDKKILKRPTSKLLSVGFILVSNEQEITHDFLKLSTGGSTSFIFTQ